MHIQGAAACSTRMVCSRISQADTRRLIFFLTFFPVYKRRPELRLDHISLIKQHSRFRASVLHSFLAVCFTYVRIVNTSQFVATAIVRHRVSKAHSYRFPPVSCVPIACASRQVRVSVLVGAHHGRLDHHYLIHRHLGIELRSRH